MSVVSVFLVVHASVHLFSRLAGLALASVDVAASVSASGALVASGASSLFLVLEGR